MWSLNMGCACLHAGKTSAAPVQMLVADPSPIRAVAWQPNARWWFTGSAEHLEAAAKQHQQPASSSSSTAASSQLFMTASNNGSIKVWDIHDVLQACQERMVTRHAVNAALWLGPPHVWVTASADGTIRSFWVDAAVQATSTATQAADGGCRHRGAGGKTACIQNCGGWCKDAVVNIQYQQQHHIMPWFHAGCTTYHHIHELVRCFDRQPPPPPPLCAVLCGVQCRAAVAMCGACLPVCPCHVLRMLLMVGWWA
jgi:hypothetical protein